MLKCVCLSTHKHHLNRLILRIQTHIHSSTLAVQRERSVLNNGAETLPLLLRGHAFSKAMTGDVFHNPSQSLPVQDIYWNQFPHSVRGLLTCFAHVVKTQNAVCILSPISVHASMFNIDLVLKKLWR